jgi:hypothetical protein
VVLPSRAVVGVALELVEDEEDGTGEGEEDGEEEDGVERLALPLIAEAGEVDGDDAEAVEGVVDDGADEGDLHRDQEGVAVGFDGAVVEVAAEADEGDVDDVDEEEEDDAMPVARWKTQAYWPGSPA